MKCKLSFFLLGPLWLLSSYAYAMGPERTADSTANPPTILWKITGPACPKPSYLLGTDHLVDAEWLFEYPEMQKVIDSTEFILTEAFSTEPPATLSTRPKNSLKALPLLTPKQYTTLDSFFVARVGEGINGNEDAQNMSVAEMEAAILMTLVAHTKGANGVTKSMDLDLVKFYQKLGRKGDRLDRMKTTAFDSTSIEQARQYLTRSLRYIEGSDQPGWTIYGKEGGKKDVARYRSMRIDYKLEERANFSTTADFDFIPMDVRNREWMSKITATISTKPCLIAVGLNHLRYRTGVIRLLRERGYRVEPVLLKKP
ncbi:TraB/GumN family protein [Larkinella harenae]